ncbi:glycosyl hydrolase family 28 protein [Sphingomonas sp. BT-65]|uniref:glycoside hydrolase family 28 protein n=1 Tax=Sphingomonas sp. BT-65 TaxID=2989821 RepID=UPI0022363F2D|nr:glycosyl hydrolase family 28 protein [Sphingomonas sp. BT-65]MCW4461011.1 glycosyl hydrolase family 28 protein [Sphingomonas sp. BT-65]
MTDMLTRRALIAAAATSSLLGLPARAAEPAQTFDVHDHGAKGDGVTPDTAAIQRAIDAAAAAGQGARVLLRAGKKYLTGPLTLRGGIDFHLQGDALLLVSVRAEDYLDPLAGVLHANGADNLTISGTGTIDGRSPEFMESYDAEGEWWVPKSFRPRLVVLENCANLRIRDLTLRQAPSWTVHLVGCRRVLVDHVTILNQMDVPNCDGIDPDHCQEVEIRDCRIVCGDDAIVIKTTARFPQYGPSRNIWVHDCVLETQDSGLKIGTETTQDIHDILFERCEIKQGCRGLTIQLRDQGNVFNILFRDIRFTARYFSAPWWGRGEAISFTAIRRTPETRLGRIYNVMVENVRGRAENSIRIDGHARGHVSDIALEKVDVTFERWTRYPGGVFDNRPTKVAVEIEKHPTPGISIRRAERVTLRDCTIRWGANAPDYFTHALHAEDAPGLIRERFVGQAAHAGMEAIRIDGAMPPA